MSEQPQQPQGREQRTTRGRREPGTWPRTVRTTIQPGRDIEVDEAEYTDLERQGLLLEPEPSVEPPSGAPAEHPAALRREHRKGSDQ